MKINKEDIEKEREIQQDVWSLRKDNYYGEDSDNFWNVLYDKVNQISEKYHSLYVDNMLIVCVEDIEARYNRSKGKSVNELEHFRHIVHVLERDRKKEG